MFPAAALSAAEPVTTLLQDDAVVVVASRLEQPVHQVGSSVAVLSVEELQARGVKYVADALLEVPSLLVTSSGPRGSQTQVRVRGNEANHVLVLVDGMRLADASSGELDLAHMTLEGVAKIEVLLGPQSTLYGTDAAAGVISITTHQGRDAPQGLLTLSAGSLDTRDAAARVQGAHNAWHYAVAAGAQRTDGISEAAEKNGNTETDGHAVDSVNLKAGYDQPAFQTWLAFNRNRSRYEFDSWDFINNIATDSALDWQTIETRGLSWVLAAPMLDGRLHNQLQISRTENDYDSYSADFGASFRRTERDAVDYQGSYRVTERHTLQFGAERLRESLRAGSFARDIGISGLYLQWLAQLGALDLSLGVRSDRHDEFGRHNTRRLTASYRLSDQWRLRGAYGTGFKTPTLTELYDDTYGVNNPALQPEESSNVELGVEYRDAGYNASVTLFDHSTRNLIRLVGVWPASQNENVNRADSQGIELTLGKAWGSVDVNAALTWMDATETDADNVTSRRLRVPDWAGLLTANYHYAQGRLWAQAQYRDERLDIGDQLVAAYWLYHAGASYDVSAAATLTARIDNLFDKDYEELYSYGTRGRTVTVGLDWRF
jgi:vitamin B12 transporter